jgi:hypothetical protein
MPARKKNSIVVGVKTSKKYISNIKTRSAATGMLANYQHKHTSKTEQKSGNTKRQSVTVIPKDKASLCACRK